MAKRVGPKELIREFIWLSMNRGWLLKDGTKDSLFLAERDYPAEKIEKLRSEIERRWRGEVYPFLCGPG